MSPDSLIIAIDGPAASGKSTVAKRVAKMLNCVFVNSGAMYRAFTFWTLEKGIDPADTAAVIDLLNKTSFTCGEEDHVGTLEIEGRQLTRYELKSNAVNQSVSKISAIPEVRARLVEEQRAYGSRASLVMEGRDIGTVVFPDTPHKFFIDADPEIRAARRLAEGIKDSIVERDQQDSMRKNSPLTVADDALVIDTSDMTIDEVVSCVVGAIQEKRGIV